MKFKINILIILIEDKWDIYVVIFHVNRSNPVNKEQEETEKNPPDPHVQDGKQVTRGFQQKSPISLGEARGSDLPSGTDRDFGVAWTLLGQSQEVPASTGSFRSLH